MSHRRFYVYKSDLAASHTGDRINKSQTNHIVVCSIVRFESIISNALYNVNIALEYAGIMI